MKQRSCLASSPTMIAGPSPRPFRFSVFFILTLALFAPGIVVAATDPYLVSASAGQLRGIP